MCFERCLRSKIFIPIQLYAFQLDTRSPLTNLTLILTRNPYPYPTSLTCCPCNILSLQISLSLWCMNRLLLCSKNNTIVMVYIRDIQRGNPGIYKFFKWSIILDHKRQKIIYLFKVHENKIEQCFCDFLFLKYVKEGITSKCPRFETSWQQRLVIYPFVSFKRRKSQWKSRQKSLL
mgnify:CR=1 FL=1